MKVLTAAALAATTLVSLGAGDAGATHGPTGTLCGMVSAVDQVVEDTMVGVLFGGPVVTNDLRRRGTPGVTLVCTVQTNAATHNATGRDVVGVTSKVTAAAEPISYYFKPGDNVYVCSELKLSPTRSLYWDQPSGGSPGSWSTDPGSSCAGTTSVEVADVKDTAADEAALDALRLAEPVVCAVLRVALPPQGDVPHVWDCPPYRDPSRRPLVGAPKRVDFALPPSTDTP